MALTQADRFLTEMRRHLVLWALRISHDGMSLEVGQALVAVLTDGNVRQIKRPPRRRLTISQLRQTENQS